MAKVFVSYSHAQKGWVRDRRIPVLRAGGSEVLYDERFRLGHDVYGGMDALQDRAEKHVLCISNEYLTSSACRHEMERALAIDPDGIGDLCCSLTECRQRTRWAEKPDVRRLHRR